MPKSHFPESPQESPEEPHIEREIANDKTGTIRRYLRLADKLLKRKDDSKSNAA